MIEIQAAQAKRLQINTEILKIVNSYRYYARELRQDKIRLQELHKKLEAFDFIIQELNDLKTVGATIKSYV